jgi:hypothetical protein
MPTANSNSTEGKWVKSTVYATRIYTITSCAAPVLNCPASWAEVLVVTKTVDAITTLCPSGAKVQFPTPIPKLEDRVYPDSGAEKSVVSMAVHIVTEVIALIPCEKPIVATFTPPTDKPPHTADLTKHIEVPLPSQRANAAQHGEEYEGKVEPAAVSLPSTNTPTIHASATSQGLSEGGVLSSDTGAVVTAGAEKFGWGFGSTFVFAVVWVWVVFF